MVLKARETLYNFPNAELEELKRGFHRIFPSKFKELLTARELGALICGELTLNLTDWMNNTIHEGITQVENFPVVFNLDPRQLMEIRE